jgi:hypothetical protein
VSELAWRILGYVRDPAGPPRPPLAARPFLRAAFAVTDLVLVGAGWYLLLRCRVI